MSIFRRRPLATAASSGESASPADRLQAEISALEGEMNDSTEALADVQARVAAGEVRAMEAIRAGDECREFAKTANASASRPEL